MQSGNAHRDFHGLLIVQARIDGRLVSVRKIAIGQTTRATRALGNILARQLKVHAAKVTAHSLVHTKR